MLGLWALHLKTGDAGVVDFGWAASIGLLAPWYAWVSEGALEQRVLAGAVGAIWGWRLALYILRDRLLGGREDGRYQYLRSHWGAAARWHFLWFFAAQALLAVLFSLPFWQIGQHPGPLGALQLMGLALSALGLAGETLADRQLARFRADPANQGKTCRGGLWRYSRHPNYFFEWLIWCGIAVQAWPAPYGPWAVLAPAAMYVFVNFITGIPYTEAQSIRSRGEDYLAYQRETNAFFPGPYRRHAG